MEEIISILKKFGVILCPGHFVGVSGRHLNMYFNKDMLFPHTKETSEVGKMFAEKCKKHDIDTVVAPALGGIILSQWTAYHLSQLKGKEIFGVYTEKTPEKDQIFTRGYDSFVKGKKVLVVEDTVTTGGSVQKVIASVKKAGGTVVAVCVMVNRDPDHISDKTFGVPFEALGVYKVDQYDPGDCELCKKGIPINTEIGHGKKFIESQKQSA